MERLSDAMVNSRGTIGSRRSRDRCWADGAVTGNEQFRRDVCGGQLGLRRRALICADVSNSAPK